MKKTESRGTLKLVLTAMLTIVFIFGTFIYLSFNGSPVERYKTRGRTLNYLLEKYPNTKFKVERTFFNFKDNSYNAKVKAENKLQTEFNVTFYITNYIRDTYIEKKFSQEAKIIIEPKIRKTLPNANVSIDVFLKEGSNYGENSKFSMEIKDIDIFLMTKWQDEKINREIFAKECVDIVRLLNSEGMYLSDYFFSCNDVKNGDYVVDIGKDSGRSEVEISLEELLKGEEISYFKHQN
ncbi:hypothetical protein [Clostridium magnum]|uniref:Uncharacterized protein n=1 Tax=Clostridium magnum DSM 2767 TaxID=1121326 RepID=A0A168DWZ7_9CLOT|nr:hypothetical protein [Clostridium magnum]KZL91570.1 hypothetical protein CLMAG_33290 [Clostridium magnum DSM 2767]SHH47964.1 hypothetical protein SAMN02745944_00766 [Clostridium magnum DSM 2767]